MLAKLTKANVDASNQCDIIFMRIGKNHFKGGTGKGGCSNQYKGAGYFTNESELTETSLKSWDRGWNTEGTLVWGPSAHGYTFDRLEK